MRVLPVLVFLYACSEYSLEEKPSEPILREDTGGGLPDARVDPSIVDLGLVCGGAGASTVTLSNVGDAPLAVRGAEVTDPSWTLGAVTLPATLAPGETLDFPVSGGPGYAVLEIYTDDLDSSTIEVPLSAAADGPPTVSITSPTDGSVLVGDNLTEFDGLLADDSDAADALIGVWSSDVDGELSAFAADSYGVTDLSWDPTLRTAGTHYVTLTTEDSCGQLASATILVCQDQGYTAENLDLSTWHFEGSAQWDASNGWVELTRPINDQSGTAFQTGSTVSADNVSIAFQFYVSGGSGADGISLTALDTDRMTGFVGATGGGIGYAGLPGWSIEVDTWYNAEYNDPTTDDHVSIHLDGQPYDPVAWAALPEMEDGNWHSMQVDVLAPHVTVSIDGVVYVDTDIPEMTAFPAYVGFTAATGGSTNFHLIDALTVTRYVCEEG